MQTVELATSEYELVCRLISALEFIGCQLEKMNELRDQDAEAGSKSQQGKEG